MPLRWLGRVDELLAMQPMPGPWQGYYGVVGGDMERARAAFDYLRLQEAVQRRSRHVRHHEGRPFRKTHRLRLVRNATTTT
ncbi:MAG: hypothetical protein U5Q44_04035 [Dehalococcoidia bacterium]|nr:hypothetical protein [Dehalococcoidia bacterium]